MAVRVHVHNIIIITICTFCAYPTDKAVCIARLLQQFSFEHANVHYQYATLADSIPPQAARMDDIAYIAWTVDVHIITLYIICTWYVFWNLEYIIIMCALIGDTVRPRIIIIL